MRRLTSPSATTPGGTARSPCRLGGTGGLPGRSLTGLDRPQCRLAGEGAPVPNDNQRPITPKSIERFVEPYHVTSGKRFRLRDFDPGDTGGLGAEMKDDAKEILERGVQLLASY